MSRSSIPTRKLDRTLRQTIRRRQLIIEKLEVRRVLATTVFSDTFETGSLNTTNWPSTGAGDFYPIVRQEGSNNGPIAASGSYAAGLYGAPYPDRGSPFELQDVGFQTKSLNLVGYRSVDLSFRVQAKGNGDLPESTDDLQVQYRTSNGAWKAFPNAGVDVASALQSTFATVTKPLPQDGIHSTSAIRFFALDLEANDRRVTFGLGEYDHWFIDNVTISGNRAPTITFSGTGTGKDDVNHTMGWVAKDLDGDALTVTAELWKDNVKQLPYTVSPASASGSIVIPKSLGLGTYTLKVSAKDTSNITTSVTSQALVISDDDSAAPVIQLAGAGGTQLSSEDQRFTWSVSDASDCLTTVAINRTSPILVSDDVAISATPSGWTLSTNPDGTRIYRANYSTNVANEFFDFNALGVGNYLIEIVATDKDNDRANDSATNTRQGVVNVLSSPPTAVANVTTPFGERWEGSPITFDAGASTDPDGGPLTFVWNFGDGTLGQGPIATHSYADNGNYVAKLTATSLLASIGETSQTITIQNVAPTVEATVPDWASEGMPFEISLAINDLGADTASLQVDWGDGATESFATAGNKSHVYEVGGLQHTLRVSVTDEDGVYSDKFVKTIDILNTAPVLTLPTFWTSDMGESIDFSAEVQDGAGDTLTYTWDFGDGESRSGVGLANTAHTYIDQGLYTLTLTVLDSDGLSSTKTSPVVVGSPVSFTTSTRSVTEADGSLMITASLDFGIPLDHDVTIPLVFSGTAHSLDYNLAATEIVIRQGAISGSTSLDLLDDSLNEDAEELVVAMGLPVRAGHGPISEQRIRIADNDTKPSFFLSSASQFLDEVSQVLTVTASLSEVSGRDVIVPLAFAGTAVAGLDYTLPAPVQVTIPAGSLTGSYQYQVLDDLNVEPAESIVVSLLPSAQAELSVALGQPSLASVIIAANDAPIVTFDSAFRLTAEGVPSIEIHARLSQYSDQPITVPFSISGSATNGADYQVINTTLSIAPGFEEAIIHVNITDDALAEGTEFFLIQMQGITNAIPGTSQSVLTNILDNDLVRVSFQAGDLSRYEGTGNLPVIVQLSNSSASETSIEILSQGTATEGTDFSVTSWQMLIPAGATQGTFNLNLLNDVQNELSESIFLSIGTITGTNTVLGNYVSKSITVLDNDPYVTLVASEASFPENQGSSTLTVQLSAPSDRNVVVPLTYSGTAKKGQDYTGPTSVTIVPGEVRKTVTLSITDDEVVEQDETIGITLGTVTGGLVSAPKSATLKIVDNDEAPTVYWKSHSYSVSESQLTRTVDVVLTKLAASNVTVTLSYAAGSAQPGEDYIAQSTSVVIPAGQLSAEFQIPIVDNEIKEDAESFTVAIVSASHASLQPDPSSRQTQVTIYDNDRLTAAEFQVINQQVAAASDSSSSDGIPSWRDLLDSVNQPPDSTGNPNDPAQQDKMLDYIIMGIGLIPIPGLDVAAVVVQHFRDTYPDGNNWINANDIGRDYQSCMQNVTAENCGLFTNTAVAIGRHYLLNYLGSQLGDLLKEGINAVGEYVGKALVSISAGVLPDEFKISVDDVQDTYDDAVAWVKGLGGYADGSLIFFDIDFNGVRSSNEPYGATTADGYALVQDIGIADLNHNNLLDFNEGQWITVGGTDTSTNQEFQTPFVGPANYSVLTPSSTLISKLLESGAFARTGLGIRAAEQRFFDAFGLADTPLAHFDFLQAAAGGDVAAARLFGTDTQIYDTVIAGASLFQGATIGLPFALIADTVFGDLAAKITSAGMSLDLTHPEVVLNILQGVQVRLGTTLDPLVLEAAAKTIAGTNRLIGDSAVEGSEMYLRSVVKVQVYAQGELSSLLKQFGSGDVSLAAYQSETETLVVKVEASPAFNLLPVYLGITSVGSVEGDEGTGSFEFIVTPYATSSLPMSVAYRTGNGTALADSDYEASTGTLTWDAEDTSPKSIFVTVYGDMSLESDESFSLFLSDPVGVSILNSVAQGTIVNDDVFSHATSAGQADSLVASMDATSLALSENGIVIFAGQFGSSATVELHGDAIDTLTVYGASLSDFSRSYESSTKQTLVLGGKTVHIDGITQIVNDVFVDMLGLDDPVLAESPRTVSASIPRALDESAVTYAWKFFESDTVESVTDGSLPTFEFVPVVGDYRLELTVTDGVKTSRVVRSFSAIDPNDAPIANVDTVTTDEDSLLTFTQADLKGNDTDVDNSNAELTVNAVSNATYGTVVLNDDGTVTFTPDINFVGVAGFDYTISDGSLSDTGHVVITVENVAPLPVIESISSTRAEGVQIDVSARVSNPAAANDILTYSYEVFKDGASAVFASNSGIDLTGFSFTPQDEGSYQVVLTVSDENGGTTTISQAISVTNVAPLAVSDEGTTDEDTLVTFAAPGLLGNDSDVGILDVLRVSSVDTIAMQGSVTVNADGSVIYDPNGGFQFLAIGEQTTDSFAYTVSDGDGGYDTTTVVFTITGVNDEPVVAAAINQSASEDAAGFAVNLLQGASDPDTSDTLNVSGLTLTSGDASGIAVSGNSLSINPSAYNHLAIGERALIRYSYDVFDGNGGSVAQAATITITGINDGPAIAAAINHTASEDAAGFTVDLLHGASDPDTSDVLDVSNFLLVSGDTYGVTASGNSLSIDPSVYNHLAVGESEGIIYSYNIIDGKGGSVAQSATVTITGLNDGPAVAAAISHTANEDTVGFTVDLLTEASDPDTSDTLNVSGLVLTSGDAAGVSVSNNSLSIDPSAYNHLAVGESEVIIYSYNVMDGNGGSVLQTATFTILGVNDGPVASDNQYSVTEDGLLSVAAAGLLADDSDSDSSDVLRIVEVNGVPSAVGTAVGLTHGTITLQPDGSFSYAPSGVSDVAGQTETFTYTVSDGNGGTAVATVAIEITPSVAAGKRTFIGGVVRIGGTDGDDIIVLRNQGGVLFQNGLSTGIAVASIDEIRVWGRGGNDTIDMGNLHVASYLHGGAGDDEIVGGSSRDLIFGGSGNDQLTGSAGHDFLAGGEGADRLVGASGNDILVAGDLASHTTRTEIEELLQLWSDQEVSVEDEEAIDEVFSDDDFDMLTGASGADWFITGSTDKITDLKKNNKEGDRVSYV